MYFKKKDSIIAEYASLKEAMETTGACRSSIGKCCRGKRNYAGGYRWAYANNKDKMFNNSNENKQDTGQ